MTPTSTLPDYAYQLLHERFGHQHFRPGQEAIIDVFVWWGGVEITVPPDWAVSNQVVAIMGGADDKSTGTQDARNRLIVRGFVVMGGVEIKTQ